MNELVDFRHHLAVEETDILFEFCNRPKRTLDNRWCFDLGDIQPGFRDFTVFERHLRRHLEIDLADFFRTLNVTLDAVLRQLQIVGRLGQSIDNTLAWHVHFDAAACVSERPGNVLFLHALNNFGLLPCPILPLLLLLPSPLVARTTMSE